MASLTLTASEIDSLRKILRHVHLSDYGSRIDDDARSILSKLKDLGEHIAIRGRT